MKREIRYTIKQKLIVKVCLTYKAYLNKTKKQGDSVVDPEPDLVGYGPFASAETETDPKCIRKVLYIQIFLTAKYGPGSGSRTGSQNRKGIRNKQFRIRNNARKILYRN
jgi:hypothetical protein